MGLARDGVGGSGGGQYREKDLTPPVVKPLTPLELPPLSHHWAGGVLAHPPVLESLAPATNRLLRLTPPPAELSQPDAWDACMT